MSERTIWNNRLIDWAKLDKAETTDNKGVANGYAPLGSDNKVPQAHIPAWIWTWDMLKFTYDTNNSWTVDNAEKVNWLEVKTAVPLNAKFTDTIQTSIVWISGTKTEYNTSLTDDEFAFKWVSNIFTENQVVQKDNKWFSTKQSNWTLWAVLSSSAGSWGLLQLADNSWNIKVKLRWYWNSYFNVWNLGIWTATPYRKLTVADAIISIINLKATGSNPYSSRVEFWRDDKASAWYIDYYHSSNDLAFITNSVERFRIKWNGNINYKNLPTSTAWLWSWDIWNDWWTLKIV